MQVSRNRRTPRRFCRRLSILVAFLIGFPLPIACSDSATDDTQTPNATVSDEGGGGGQTTAGENTVPPGGDTGPPDGNTVPPGGNSTAPPPDESTSTDSMPSENQEQEDVGD